MKTWPQRLGASLINLTIRLNQFNSYRATIQTLSLVFPFVLVAAFCQALNASLLTNNGFFAEILAVPAWLPHYQFLSQVLTAVTSATTAGTSLMTAFLAAAFIADQRGASRTLAGFTSMMVFLILDFDFGNLAANQISFSFPNVRNFLFSLLVGLLTGLIFAKLTGDREMTIFGHDSLHKVLYVSTKTTLPMVGILGGVGLLSALSRLIIPAGFFATFDNLVKMPLASTTRLLNVLFTDLFNNLLLLLGLNGPIAANFQGYQNDYSIVNINYYLARHSTTRIPYPTTMYTLYHPFGAFGGPGMTLGLVIAIALYSNSHNLQRVNRLSLFPSIVNLNTPLLYGVPLILNPLYVLPFLGTSLITISLGRLATVWQLIQPTVFSIPWTTFGPFKAFLGAGNNWPSLILSIFDTLIAVWCYRPFVKLDNQFRARLRKEVVTDGQSNSKTSA